MLRRHIADSEDKSSEISREIATQKNFLQDNASWVEKLTNLVNGLVKVI